jgi:hypothetical protein
LKFPTITTNHLEGLTIITQTGLSLYFPSIIQQSAGKLMDYHKFHVVKPPFPYRSFLHPTAKTASTIHLTRELIHQRLGHSCNKKIDTMCRSGTLRGLPKRISIITTHMSYLH